MTAEKEKEEEAPTPTEKFRAMYAKAMPPVPVTIVKDHDDTGKYLAAILGSLIIGIGGLALIIWLRPEYDPLLVAGVIFAFLTPTTTSLLSFMKQGEIKEEAKRTREQTIETHLSVNSRLDEFIKEAKASARAEGENIGRAAANQRTDDLKEQATKESGA